ncbi:MAG TPA: metallophosphoesterase, partial [Devosiaceae bacterium]|nr:metallophosphoesterase [Devosiaceae bacterium]
MIELAHISDVHLSPLPRFSPLALANKRLTGYLHWVFTRKDRLRRDTATELVRHMLRANPDLIAVTGDLVNLALPAEIDRAAGWLASLGPPGRVAVVPGNHDAYVPGALDRCAKAWGDYMKGQRLGDARFPYIKRKGEVALIGCSSAVATAPFMATGQFDVGQAGRLQEALRLTGEEGLFRVVMIHHAPTAEWASGRRGLRGAGRFRIAVERAGAELILHGHLHESTVSAIPGPHGDVPVVGVAAVSAAPGLGGA